MQNPSKYSKIIAGTMTWGQWGKQLSTEEMTALIRHCVTSGITTFDHADIYGGYTTESDFGKAWKDSGINRDSVQFISKCGIQYVCDARKNRVKHYSYRKDYILSSVNQSLKNLETEYLDLLLLHRPSPLMHPEEVAEAVAELIKEGKIRDFGVSNFTPSQITLIGSAVPVDANQVEFSLTATEPMFNGVLDDCILHRRMAMAWSPLGSYFREDDARKKRLAPVMKRLREKYSATDSQLLLAWIVKHPARVVPVVGTTQATRLVESLAAAGIELGDEDWFEMLTAAQGHKVP